MHDPRLVHGCNLEQKEGHKTKYLDETSRKYVKEIRERYDQWHKENMELIGPGAVESDRDCETIERRTRLFEDYKAFIDQQHYAEQFDSRSNLHSSVLEEFMYYLFKDLVEGFGEHALIGKSHAFKDVFFFPPSYRAMLVRPYARIERKDHDFVIGATYAASFNAKTPPVDQTDAGDAATRVEEAPDAYIKPSVTTDVESHLFDIPAVAIECKTYLDKTMLEGSSRAAEELKARHPNGLYIVVMEWIKLTEAVNPRKYKVDQIYILRKQKNTDREFRYLDSYEKKPISVDVVTHLFQTVRSHLTTDWAGGVASGLDRGWLLG